MNDDCSWEHTFTRHFIRKTILILGKTTFSLRPAQIFMTWFPQCVCFKLLVLVDMFLQSDNYCRLVSCIFMLKISHSTTSHWIQICRLGRPLKYTELMETDWDDLCFVTCCIIMLDVAIIRWVLCGHKGKHMVVIYTVLFKQCLIKYQEAQHVPRKHSPELYTTSTRLNCWHKAS